MVNLPGVPQDEIIDLAKETAAAASGQHGPLRMLAAWLLIVGAVIVTSTIGWIATVILVVLIIPILTLGAIWAISNSLAGESAFGHSVKEIILVAGPAVAVVAFLAGSWPIALLVLFATVAIVAAG